LWNKKTEDRAGKADILDIPDTEEEDRDKDMDMTDWY